MEDCWVFVTASGGIFSTERLIYGIFADVLRDSPVRAYCSDFKIRTLVKIEKWRPVKPGLLARFSKLDQGGEPVLSEPIASYTLDELKPIVSKALRDYVRHFGKKQEIARAMNEATTFDQVYRLYASPDAYLAEHYGIEEEN